MSCRACPASTHRLFSPSLLPLSASQLSPWCVSFCWGLPRAHGMPWAHRHLPDGGSVHVAPPSELLPSPRPGSGATSVKLPPTPFAVSVLLPVSVLTSCYSTYDSLPRTLLARLRPCPWGGSEFLEGGVRVFSHSPLRCFATSVTCDHVQVMVDWQLGQFTCVGWASSPVRSLRAPAVWPFRWEPSLKSSALEAACLLCHRVLCCPRRGGGQVHRRAVVLKRGAGRWDPW